MYYPYSCARLFNFYKNKVIQNNSFTLTDILYNQFFVPYSTAERELNILRNKVKEQIEDSNNLNVFVTLMKDLTISWNQPKDCILLSAFLANADLAESAHFVTSIINHDIMKALHFGGVCSYTAYEDDQIAIDINIEDLTNLALDILKFVQGWLQTKLINQWPGTQMRYAINTIKEKIVDFTLYNITAEKVAKALIIRGLPGYHYHVLVIENWQGDKWIYGPSCSADNCNLTNTNGVNIITFRQKIYSIELAISAKDWCNKTEATILSVLEEHGNKPSLNLIVGYINGKVGGLSTRDGYHSFFVARNMKWFGFVCDVYYGIYAQPALTETTYSIIQYYEQRFPWNNIMIKLFLFI